MLNATEGVGPHVRLVVLDATLRSSLRATLQPDRVPTIRCFPLAWCRCRKALSHSLGTRENDEAVGANEYLNRSATMVKGGGQRNHD